MRSYYSEKLSAERLHKCYEIAPPRVKQYLEAEIDFVLTKSNPDDKVLELGCGYGRVLHRLVDKVRIIVGIDIAIVSLRLAQQKIPLQYQCNLLAMNAASPGFKNNTFDLVICIQNGISAFKVNQRGLIEEAIRVTRPGGTILFSSYSDRFWQQRLEWFRLQAAYDLIGAIDEEKTGNGIIVCKDGFKATTISPADFFLLTERLGVVPTVQEVDESSLFCEIVKPVRDVNLLS